jgi:membrane fusion protein (multidrug efflux system)
MLKNKSFWVIAITVILLVALKLLFFPNQSQQPGGNQPGKGGPQKPVVVDGIIVTGSSLEENISAIGTLLANEEAELRAEIQGRIAEINFTEGTAVSKGALLIKLNDADLKAQLVKLEANLKLQKENAVRQKKLFEMNGVSRQQFDEAQTLVSSTEADISFTKAQIEKTEIRAPFSGIVGLRSISVGRVVGPGDVIATLQQTDPVKLDFSVPEKYAAMVSKGNEVQFTIDGNTTIQNAKIYAMEPKVDPQTRTVRVRAIGANPDGKLIPGSFARVMFSISKSNNAFLVPTQSVIPVLKGKKVMIVRNGMAVSQMVTTGLRQEKEIEILDGLKSGDTVLTTGLMQARDSMMVDVKVFQ